MIRSCDFGENERFVSLLITSSEYILEVLTRGGIGSREYAKFAVFAAGIAIGIRMNLYDPEHPVKANRCDRFGENCSEGSELLVFQ